MPEYCILGTKFSDQKIFRQVKFFLLGGGICPACQDATKDDSVGPISRSRQ